jgi:hypothetical protein
VRRSSPWLLRAAMVTAGTGAGAAAAAAAAYVGLVTGVLPVDLRIGRRARPLGPQVLEVAAPREVVFDVVAQPYLGRPTRALADKIRVLERGTDMVLAAHFTPVGVPVPTWILTGAATRVGGRLGRRLVPRSRRLRRRLSTIRLVAQTVETVRFTHPGRVDFRLVRGPVPHVIEEFVLSEPPSTSGPGPGTRLVYQGEMAADLWRLGQWWSALVARRWEQTVAASLAAIKAEAERRASTPSLQ